MSKSAYQMQIVTVGTKPVVVAAWPPGATGELDLIESVAEAVRAKGVGLFRTEAHVINDVREVLRQTLYALKASVKP